MKKLTAIVIGIFLLTILSVILNTQADAGSPWHHGHHGSRGHHYQGHHGPFWGGAIGPGVVVHRSPVAVGYGCYLIKRSYINEFGQRFYRWIEVCN